MGRRRIPTPPGQEPTPIHAVIRGDAARALDNWAFANNDANRADFIELAVIERLKSVGHWPLPGQQDAPETQ